MPFFTNCPGSRILMLLGLLATSSSPAFGQFDIKVDWEKGEMVLSQEQEGFIQMALSSFFVRPVWPTTDRTIAQALQSAKQYSTFLSLVERGKLMPLLEKAAVDTTTPTITFFLDSLSIPDLSSFGIQVDGVPLDKLSAGPDTNKHRSAVMNVVQKKANRMIMPVLTKKDNITVFAPTDSAFAALPKAMLDSLMRDSAAAASLVRSHIVSRGISRDMLKKVHTMTPLAGPEILVSSKAETPAVNGVAVVEADLAANNGIVYGIGVVLHPRAATDGQTPR